MNHKTKEITRTNLERTSFKEQEKRKKEAEVGWKLLSKTQNFGRKEIPRRSPSGRSSGDY